MKIENLIPEYIEMRMLDFISNVSTITFFRKKFSRRQFIGMSILFWILILSFLAASIFITIDAYFLNPLERTLENKIVAILFPCFSLPFLFWGWSKALLPHLNYGTMHIVNRDDEKFIVIKSGSKSFMYYDFERKVQFNNKCKLWERKTALYGHEDVRFPLLKFLDFEIIRKNKLGYQLMSDFNFKGKDFNQVLKLYESKELQPMVLGDGYYQFDNEGNPLFCVGSFTGPSLMAAGKGRYHNAKNDIYVKYIVKEINNPNLKIQLPKEVLPIFEKEEIAPIQNEMIEYV